MPNSSKCPKGAAEYFRCVKIRDSANAQGMERQRRCRAENRERSKYAAIDYTHRLTAFRGESGDIDGILDEWEEAGMADDCFQKLLKRQIMTDA